MPHYNAYDSFKTKRSIANKERAKEKSFSKYDKLVDNFIIDSCDNYGIVLEVKYDNAYVLFNGDVINAKLRNDVNLVCNKVLFPGDRVNIVSDGNSYLINNLVKRKSLLSRVKVDSTRKNDIGLSKNIAANIDLAVIVVAAKEPPLHPKFIDRYLIILQNSSIPCIICLNKCDLKTDEDSILMAYKDLGITVIETSTLNGNGIDKLEELLLGKQAIFVGNSGVGKSSLTNALMNYNSIKTGSVGNKSKRGKHTTSSSKYYLWNDNSSIIDTPGIRSLDVSSFNALEIRNYFSEFDKWNEKCKYRNCLHYNEPYSSCVVKQAVFSDLINRDRYESYLKILDNLMDKNSSSDIINDVFSVKK